MTDSDLAIRVVQRYVMASFVQGLSNEEPPPAAEIRQTRKIFKSLLVGVGQRLKSLERSQTAERRVLQALSKTLLGYNVSPTLRIEQDIQYHMLLALKHVEGSVDPRVVAKDTKALSTLFAQTPED